MKSNQSRQNPVKLQVIQKTLGGIPLRIQMLIAFALFAVVPPLVIGTTAAWLSAQGLRENAFNALNSVAVLKSNAIHEWLQVLQTNLPLAFENQDVRDGVFALLENDENYVLSQPQLRRQLSAFKDKTGYFVEIFVLDRNGRVVLSTDGAQEGKIHKTQDFFQNGLTGQFVSSPIYEVSFNNYSITFSEPVQTANGTVSGVLAGRANLSRLSEIMEQETALGDFGETYLVSSNFAALTTLKNTDFELGQTYVRTQGVSESLKSKTDGAAKYVDYAGNDTFGVYKLVPELQIALIAEHQERDALEPATHVVQVSFAVIIIGTVLSLVLAVIFTGTITGPIDNLVKVAQNVIGNNNLDIRADVTRNDEIGVLARAFNTMTEQLRIFIGTLEQHVQIRTQALSWVAEVGISASTIMETDSLLQQVVDMTKERFGFYHTHIYLLNETGDTLLLASGAGEVGRQMVVEGHSIPLDWGQSLVARVAREKKGVTVNDVTQMPDFLPNPLLPNTRSELAVPMLMGEQVIGVFDVQSDVVGRFTDTDIAVQTTLASQIAVAVQNARSFTKVKEAEQLTRTIVDAAADAIYIKDRNHRYLMVNEAFANSLHRPVSEIIGKDDLELGFPEELVKGNPEKGIRGYWTQDDLVIETGEKHSFFRDDFVIGDQNRLLDTLKIPLRNVEGEIWAVLAYTRDVTESEFLHNLTAKHARQQEAINLVSQKIQSTITIEEALQVAAREVGHVLGRRETIVTLEPLALAGDEDEQVVSKNSRSTL